MTDTPQHIKDLQLKIWLSKTPAERLRQFLIDNDALYTFWDQAKKSLQPGATSPEPASDVKAEN